MITIIHGPVHTGKTYHARAFAAHFGCTSIVDDADRHHRDAPFPPDGALILTTLSRREIIQWQERAVPNPDPLHRHKLMFVDITSARLAIGVAPHAPTVAERLSR